MKSTLRMVGNLSLSIYTDNVKLAVFDVPCNVTSLNIKSGRHLCWTRHPHMHLAAAAQPLFDPRVIEHRRLEDERERCFELTRERWPTNPPLTK
ncbi:hypothetical protein TNCV_168951 [Trichonephila clavipes]|nr:hypothetical protein TNCV_168951 [Trichonephila clavipes]